MCIRDRTWIEDAESAFEHLRASSKGPYGIIGLSFGGLLSLNLASLHSEELFSVAVMSVPIRFRKFHRSVGLRFLAYFPDWFLDLLPCVDKTKRAEDVFAEKRIAFEEHSVAAGARLVQVRVKMFANLRKLKAPLLALYDPEDHHVAENSDEILKESYQGSVYREAFFPGGQHELTLGKRKDEVFVCVENFLKEQLCQES